MRQRHPVALAWSALFAAILASAVFFTRPPQADDASSVQQTVQSQLQAFAQHDAGAAFSLADPALRTRFGNAQEFFTTVSEQYPMVLRPASVLFLKPHSDGSIALQKVRITDEQGANWQVTYLLNRQHDRQWRISGTLVEAQGPRITT